MKFEIVSIYAVRAGFSGEMEAKVTIQLDSKSWIKFRDKGDLGSLYLSVSNEVYGLMHKSIDAYRPTVNDRERASKGIKTVFLYYNMTAEQVKNLGINPFDYQTRLYTPGTAALRKVGA
jgi:hypothetical protein